MILPTPGKTVCRYVFSGNSHLSSLFPALFPLENTNKPQTFIIKKPQEYFPSFLADEFHWLVVVRGT